MKRENDSFKNEDKRVLELLLRENYPPLLMLYSYIEIDEGT